MCIRDRLYIGGMGAKGKNFYNDLCCQYGFPDEAAAVQDAYLDGRRDEAIAAFDVTLISLSTYFLSIVMNA